MDDITKSAKNFLEDPNKSAGFVTAADSAVSSTMKAINEKVNKWGGKRQGSGRPSTLQNPVRVTIWLEAEQLAWVKSQGEQGEVIRRLIDEARNATTK